MTRIRHGWQLAKDSFAILRDDRSLALFPIVSFACTMLALLLVMGPGVVLAVASEQALAAVPFVLLGAYVATFLAIAFNVALAGAARLSMDGRDTTLRDGLAVARERWPQIAMWALVQLAVGFLIQLISSIAESLGPAGKIVGAILSGLLGAAWAITTFFVVPLLAFEGVGPREAMRRSVALVRERWGEGLVGSASIGGIVALVAFLPAIGLLALGGVAAEAAPALAVVLLVLGVLVVLAASVIGSALSIIFRVALFRFAEERRAPAGFAQADLEQAFVPKR